MSNTPFLTGVRVLDITAALAGPYCTTILSDLGAEVIKVEPVDGDPMRRRMAKDGAGSLPFALIHRNKRSLAIDLKTTAGCEAIARLAEQVDVLVENFRPGALEALGLGYEQLRPTCPDLVYCSISGFGQTGPKRHLKGLDLIAQAYGGLMSVTGSIDGEIAKAGYPVSDLGSGMWGAIGVLAALRRAHDGGGGAYIDVALADTVASWSVWETSEYVTTGEPLGPLGTAHRLVAPYEGFPCSDGEMLVLGAVERLWPRLLDLLGLDELAEDPRFGSDYERFRNREALAAILRERFMTAPRDHWIAELTRIGVPSGPVNSIADIISDEQYAAREMFVHDEERFGQPTLVNTPILADGAPRIRSPAPRLGEDTIALLEQAGLDPAEIRTLVERGVVHAESRVAPAKG